jgi:ABC-type lipoprotein release transport system permease subunit
MIWSISWRNIWRNKVRSTVVIVAITLGICAGVFSTAFFKGMMNQRIEQVISNELSHIQIHHPEFRSNMELSNYISSGSELTGKIAEIPEVEGVSNRIVIFSMVSSAETASGARIVGINPEDEIRVSNMEENIIEGEYFNGVKKNPVLIGKKLAEKLKVRIRSKIVITLQDLENNITGGAFRVVGIFETPNSTYDETTIFVQSSDLARLIELPDKAGHEIAVLVSNNELVDTVQYQIRALDGEQEVLTWKELSPEMGYLTEVMDLYMYIFIIIILLALLFGIINTMLMVVLERVKELGMLMAVGMNKFRVFSMIVLETILLTLVGGITGTLAGSGISKYFETHAIDMSLWAEGYSQLGYDTMVYTSIDVNLMVTVIIMVLFTGVVAAIYPAFKALKHNPAEALRIE